MQRPSWWGNSQWGKDTTSVTTAFSGDRVNYYFADSKLSLTQRNSTLVDHYNEYFADTEEGMYYLFLEQKH
jgi:hypothetical protein